MNDTEFLANAHIRFSPTILQRLGEELNPSPDVGILELVKNAYDADAINCTIELINTNQSGGAILIKDDGDGMDVEAIRDKWLLLGESGKSVSHMTKLGRTPAGSKGLGRLAALRMGNEVALSTCPKCDSTKQYNLYIDWSNYENAKTVEEVNLVIQERSPQIEHGTEILLQGLHSAIGRMDVKKLARKLILLADPFGDNPHGFKPHLIAPEFAEFESLVQNRYFEDAEYYLTVEVNKQGYIKALVTDHRGGELFSANHEELTKKRGGKPYNCPPAKFDLWVFILKSDSFSTRKITLAELQRWLKEFGGVHLYENGLRVSPYGDQGNDWLEMNIRRVQSPEERPATNSSLGRISVLNINQQLLQKTDRSGFIENEAFLDLKLFAQDAMDWMAKKRLQVAEERRQKKRDENQKKSSQSKKNIEQVIAHAPASVQVELKQAFDSYEHSRNKEIEQLQQELQLYRTLSTAGITAATFAHESSGNPIKVITQSIKAIERRGKELLAEQYYQVLENPVSQIIKAVHSLGVLGEATLKLLNHEKRRLGRVEIHEVIKGVLATFQPFLEGREVSVVTEFCPSNPYLRGSEATIESIITNLINNSLIALEGALSRNIIIRTTIENNKVILQLLDNGHGIQEINIEDIWLPGQTTRPNGTGLGLTIVRDTVTDLNGEVKAIAKSELGGAEFIIKLPILGS